MSTSQCAVPCSAVRVLLVDDEETFRANLAGMLRDDGHMVIDCKSAEAALAADTSGIAILVTDYSMPGQSGLALADKLHARHPDLPVVIVSAYRTQALEAQAKTRSFVSVLSKPLEFEELHALIHRLVH